MKMMACFSDITVSIWIFMMHLLESFEAETAHYYYLEMRGSSALELPIAMACPLHAAVL